MKFILSCLLLLLCLNLLGQQNTENKKITIESMVKDGGLEYTFENQRNLKPDRIERFTSRISNGYDIIESIVYSEADNDFKIRFNTKDIDDVELKDILSHFDVYNFSISK